MDASSEERDTLWHPRQVYVEYGRSECEEPTSQDRWEAKPWAPLPRAWGLRLPITYINSGAQPGPICRPPPHLGSPRQPARARWWLGGVAVRGGPRSPSPHLAPPPTHAPNLLFLILPPQSSTTPKSKKSDRARHRQLLCCTASLPPAPPRARASPGPAPRPFSLPPRADLIARPQPSLCGRADS